MTAATPVPNGSVGPAKPTEEHRSAHLANEDHTGIARSVQHGWCNCQLGECNVQVQAGVARTGKWWGHQHVSGEAVEPDIMIFAKGIASGFPFAGASPCIPSTWTACLLV